MRFFERDLSWLSFNHRVLQEAADPGVPLIERIKFLAIFSSNLEEFYRVRVANYYKLVELAKSDKSILEKNETDPGTLIEKINRVVDKHQQEFGSIFNKEIVPALKSENIHIIQKTSNLTVKQLNTLRTIYDIEIKPHLDITKLNGDDDPFLINSQVYFLIRSYLKDKVEYHMCKLPVEEYGRFIHLIRNKRNIIIQIDDVVRYFLQEQLEGSLNCYAFKVTRDAELYLEEEFDGTMVDRIRKSLSKRETGTFTRMLYDENIPADALKFLRNVLSLRKRNLVRGGRYHNFADFFAFPKINNEKLYYTDQPDLEHPQLEGVDSIKSILLRQDVLLHYPYHKFGYTIEFLREALNDPATKHIYISLYRVSSTSEICKLLIDACSRKIKVTVFDEIKARFDEESNIYWGEQLEKAGAEVIYSFEDLKVHTKLLCIDQSTETEERYLSYLATGNFNANTAKIYSDFALLTSDIDFGRDIRTLFDFFRGIQKKPLFKELLIAPFKLRGSISKLIDHEITRAQQGKPAMLTFKLNSLQDMQMIKKLYEASQAGVKVRLIVRGICCLVPGVKGLSENIEIRSIVDRYLEHARVYIFHSSSKIYLSSADLMSRNLSRRFEVAFELKDPKIAEIVKSIIELQWSDNVKARKINIRQTNPYHRNNKSKIRSQYKVYESLNDLYSRE